MSEEHDFRNCGWAGKTRNLVDAWFCNKKKLQLRDADLGIGICPCFAWLRRVEIAIKGPEKVMKSNLKGDLL